MEKFTPSSRRRFFKSLAAGAVFGPSGLTIAKDGVQPVSHPEGGEEIPEVVRGEVLRTGGSLAEDGLSLLERARAIPLAGRTQVIVCGGGPAGISAALAAARAGAEVCLIELAGCLGGVWTAGLLTKILDTKNKSGIMAELLKGVFQTGKQGGSRNEWNGLRSRDRQSGFGGVAR